MVKIGILIVADPPQAGSGYDRWIAKRSTSESGTYSAINGTTGQAITDLSYYDQSGSSSSWYKISYYNSVTSQESGLSDANKGQSTAYTTVRKIQNKLQLFTISDSTNPDIQAMVELINEKEDEIDNVTNHAWRLRYSGTISGQATSAEYEMVDIANFHEYQTGRPVYLKRRKIREMDADEGDALEYWNGSEWEDWLSTKTEARENDFWFDYPRGILYLRGYYRINKPLGLRIKYRYGETLVNLEISNLCTMMCLVEILLGMDSRAMIVQEGSVAMTHEQRITKMEKDIDIKLQRYKEFQMPVIKL